MHVKISLYWSVALSHRSALHCFMAPNHIWRHIIWSCGRLPTTNAGNFLCSILNCFFLTVKEIAKESQLIFLVSLFGSNYKMLPWSKILQPPDIMIPLMFDSVVVMYGCCGTSHADMNFTVSSWFQIPWPSWSITLLLQLTDINRHCTNKQENRVLLVTSFPNYYIENC